jgi:hypothetical protein
MLVELVTRGADSELQSAVFIPLEGSCKPQGRTLEPLQRYALRRDSNRLLPVESRASKPRHLPALEALDTRDSRGSRFLVASAFSTHSHGAHYEFIVDS